mmetsp:Transcript_41425/g.48300  ORF Transcript_41425/g.48300 Transcript_41425/m.48300 type:complete len:143 (+) Transcript_41425:79-507(+)|eukprot:CAMPEP_0194448564 /NCGR_PEP_ID=MMETSP0176-20130528/129642_1 /TAXON_ID=216777 /ORGANISM="Proboscia alata, Strain PI-D3" /LENGTH=142 /DNA_ID=CAMNT_0039275563 /DNA_START=513 /DNA_END=941 /DNA_ORIENTATION=-
MNALKGLFGLKDEVLPPGPTKLPPYFPVVPKGCEAKSDELFNCISGAGTSKLRMMEKEGTSTSYYDKKPEIVVNETSVGVKGEAGQQNVDTHDALEPCREFLVKYQTCCKRELKKKKNWILTEPYRVQEEYRYNREEEKGAN